MVAVLSWGSLISDSGTLLCAAWSVLHKIFLEARAHCLTLCLVDLRWVGIRECGEEGAFGGNQWEHTHSWGFPCGRRFPTQTSKSPVYFQDDLWAQEPFTSTLPPINMEPDVGICFAKGKWSKPETLLSDYNVNWWEGHDFHNVPPQRAISQPQLPIKQVVGAPACLKLTSACEADQRPQFFLYAELQSASIARAMFVQKGTWGNMLGWFCHRKPTNLYSFGATCCQCCFYLSRCRVACWLRSSFELLLGKGCQGHPLRGQCPVTWLISFPDSNGPTKLLDVQF